MAFPAEDPLSSFPPRARTWIRRGIATASLVAGAFVFGIPSMLVWIVHALSGQALQTGGGPDISAVGVIVGGMLLAWGWREWRLIGMGR